MTVSGRQKCDANVCRLLGAIARLPALGPRPDLTPVASDVTANEQRDKRRDRDSGNKKERERESVWVLKDLVIIVHCLLASCLSACIT